jgi:hypothetical protein
LEPINLHAPRDLARDDGGKKRDRKKTHLNVHQMLKHIALSQKKAAKKK